MHLNFLDKGCDLSYSIDKDLSSESADKLRSLAYLRRSEAFCLTGSDEGSKNGLAARQRIWMERSARQMLCSCSPGMVSRDASDADELSRMSMMDIREETI